MKRIWPCFAAAVFAAAVQSSCADSTVCVTATSPDGRNEISVSLNPLRFCAKRDGVLVVAETEVGMDFGGTNAPGRLVSRNSCQTSGSVSSPVYKKNSVDLSRGEAFLDFGDIGLRLVARNDGVAYRFEAKAAGPVRVCGEKGGVAVPDGAARCWVNFTKDFGLEETVPEALSAADVRTEAGGERAMAYLPFVYSVGGKTVAFTESDVCDYPNMYLERGSADGSPLFEAVFQRWPSRTVRAENDAKWNHVAVERGGRWVDAAEYADWLVETDGPRAFPWRVFAIADEPSKLCEADIVWALARPPAAEDDFSWVKPGKVAWEWWNHWNVGDVPFKAGCNTATYEKYIDFAAANGIEYVILDEGWSERLDIWRFRECVDVPHLIGYARERGVGIILWMAWAQAFGEEARVASRFSELGAAGFKVDFIDRADAAATRFMWKFAEECRRCRMIVDYHGATRPTGLSRTYPNVLNFEGVHGLEQMKFYRKQDILTSDVRAFYLRMTAGPMDYTPGAMDNYPVGKYAGKYANPGSFGTRSRQMAMMALYEAPLQMLCDSPAKYARNAECLSFMAATPVVWDDTAGLGGTPDTYAAAARKAKDGSWYAAGISNQEARDAEIDTSFLGEGEWAVEAFRDAAESDVEPTAYVHERFAAAAGDRLRFHMAPGGGFVARFTPLKPAGAAVDLTADLGPVKPVNGVGQPPIVSAASFPMFRYLKDAGIPYVRLHDVGGMFGRGVFVDIPNLFRDFDADENDPANYDFAFTDRLVAALVEEGLEPFFRLGVTIENYPHIRRYRIDPPKDFAKWARICEHVIRHYTEGWAGGTRHKIGYWEIWNEAENWESEEKNNMWHGPFSEYCRLYDVASKHLKAKFPHLKIGGYAATGLTAVTGTDSPRAKFHLACFHEFLAYVKEHGSPLDYFSFHSYSPVDKAVAEIEYVRAETEKAGFPGLELCLDEWLPKPRSRPRHDVLGTAEQAADVAAALVAFQNSTLDSAMIYDARCGVGDYAPLFNPLTYKPHKAYWAFVAFNELRRLGRAAPVRADGVRAAAASGNGEFAVMVVNDSDEPRRLSLELGGATARDCRITDDSRTWAESPIPDVMPPCSFIVVKGGVQ